jgi:Ca2+-binding RTX toxin-like protein
VVPGTSGDDTVNGNGGDDTLSGAGGNDTLDGGDGNDSLSSGDGTDSLNGGADNDSLYFGPNYTNADSADGGTGTDTMILQGNYPGGLLGSVAAVEVLLIASGADTRFGDNADNRYDYTLTSQDSNVAAGELLTVMAAGLLPGEDLSFDGSAETNGGFRIFAGRGNDHLTGGGGSDGFFFGADGNLTAADAVTGGGGIDTLALRGNYSGAGAVVFQNGSFSGIEVVALLSGLTNEYGGPIAAGGYDYELTLADSNVAAGQRLDINGARLAASESIQVDAHLESDGSVRILAGSGDDALIGSAGADYIYGGLGSDVMTGGNGNDVYAYRSTLESTSASRDTINFAAGDKIDLSLIDAIAGTAGTNDAFTFIGTAAFGQHEGELRATQASANVWVVEGDVNGDGTADIVITVNSVDPIVAGDFVP